MTGVETHASILGSQVSGSEYDLNTDEWREGCPDGFIWDYCGESGWSAGCERREYHEAEEVTRMMSDQRR